MGEQIGPNSVPIQYALAGKLIDRIGGGFGGGGGWGAWAGGHASGLGPVSVQTPYNPAPIYGSGDLQWMRNLTRAGVPTALASSTRNTPAGVSSTLGTETDILRQQQMNRMQAEDAVQQAMLQARLANAQNILSGQAGALESGYGLAGGVLDQSGIDQRLRYGLAGQQLQRQNTDLDFLWGVLGPLLGNIS